MQILISSSIIIIDDDHFFTILRNGFQRNKQIEINTHKTKNKTQECEREREKEGQGNCLLNKQTNYSSFLGHIPDPWKRKTTYATWMLLVVHWQDNDNICWTYRLRAYNCKYVYTLTKKKKKIFLLNYNFFFCHDY